MSGFVNIRSDMEALLNNGKVLDRLLEDKTTGKNILWATDRYSEKDRDPGKQDHITREWITDAHADRIRPRVMKARAVQGSRTKQNAEVFTPAWICNRMNNQADEQWFGYSDVFNHETGTGWTPVSVPARFPEGRTWQEYVCSTRLEITCGEAPFLVSRYDAATGEIIPVSERIGMLDRKLRVVSDHTETYEEWLKWTARAYQSVYGYEWQGDNLLIARINLLSDFIDNMWWKWQKAPVTSELEQIADVIAWNLWQMDGLKGTIPDHGVTGNRQPGKRCRIYDWPADRSIEYASLKYAEPQGDEPVKRFDFIIGNPPYQDLSVGEQKNYARPIYHFFLDEAYRIGEQVEMIHPARFLANAGSTPKAWNRKMLNDRHVKVLYYEPDSEKVFPGLATPIKGGIAVTYRDRTRETGPIGLFTMTPEIRSIMEKVHAHPGFERFSQIVVTRTAYRFTEKMHEENPAAIHQLSNGHAYDVSTNIFARLPQVFSDEKPDDGRDYIRILGREDHERTYKYIRRDYINPVINLDSYKLFLPKANGVGRFGEALTAPVIGQPAVGATETFISIGKFRDEQEAHDAGKYICTKFARALLGILKVTQDLSPEKWAEVPLQDFTSGSDIDWRRPMDDIDRQLYRKYALDEKEIAFIESHVRAMEQRG